MRTDTHNEWTDAFRESFPEEVRPADGGWEAVARRVRRAAARRRAAIVAAALALPLAGGVFFLTSRQPATEDPPTVVAEALPAPAAEPEAIAAVPDNVTERIEVIPVQKPALLAEVRSMPDAERGETDHSDSFVDLQSPQNDKAEQSPQNDKENVIPSSPVVILSEAKESITEASGPTIHDTPGDDAFDGDLFADDAPARRASRLAIGLTAGSVAGGAPTEVTVSSMAGSLNTKASNWASNNFLSNYKGSIMQKEYVHDLPLSFGLTARYSLTDRLSIESGIEYTYLHSRLDDIHTVMHLAGIPLQMDYNLFTAGPVELYAGVGGTVEKCLKATLGGLSVKERDLQWSGSVSAGARYKLSRNAWLYLQPDVSYYFTRTILATYRTENRLGLTFRAGLLFDINR